jgi:lipase chaperone LimK
MRSLKGGMRLNMSKQSDWEEYQDYQAERKRAKDRRRVSHHDDDCTCRKCREAHWHAQQESE